MEKKKEITIPYNFKPREYQLPFLKAMDNGKKRAVLVWNRRAGKDKTAFNYLIKKMVQRVGTYYYFFPTYNQAKKVIWDGIDGDGFKFIDHIPKEIIDKKNDTEMKITLKNGSVFQLIGSESIDNIVGTNPIGCLFSEYSIQKPEAWDFIRPILAQNGGWAVFVFTPRGMNHGWKLLQQAKGSNQWFSQILTIDDTKCIPKEVLENEEKEMPTDLYDQEYYCKFIDGAGAFFRRIENNLWNGQIDIEPGKIFHLGVDLAKYQDYTVITPFDTHTFQMGTPERFNQIDWNLQKAKIEAMARKFNNAKIILDATGIGDPIFDDLVNAGLSVEPFKFTNESKKRLLMNFATKLEKDEIQIPNYEQLISEMRSLTYQMTERGRLKLEAPSGLHDDCVMSAALSLWGSHIPLNKTCDADILEIQTTDW